MPCNSMTGYGQAATNNERYLVNVEMRALNHRFSDFHLRLPRELFFVEGEIRAYLSAYLTRGRVDLYVTLRETEQIRREVRVDWALLGSLHAVAEEAHRRFGAATFDPVSIGDWLQYPDVLTVVPETTETEALQEVVMAAVRDACAGLLDMRHREGQRLTGDLLEKVQTLQSVVGSMRRLIPTVIQTYREKMERKRAEFVPEIDSARFMVEIAGLFEKLSIDEELVRLDSHLQEFTVALDAGSPVGRKLDFLVQEMHREANTIGAKAIDAGISRWVVEAKTAIEQMREQVQNLE